MGKVYFGTIDGKELRPLGEVGEIELTSEESGIDDIKRFSEGRSDSFECEVKLEKVGKLDPWRFLASGCDQGTYNSMTLKEDGCLNPENGWIKGDI